MSNGDFCLFSTSKKSEKIFGYDLFKLHFCFRHKTCRNTCLFILQHEMATFNEINSSLSLAIGWPANLLLIWLILFHTNQQIRSWRLVLLQTAVVDLVVSLMFFLVHPIAQADGHLVVYVLDGPFAHSPQPIGLILYYFYSFWQEFAKYAVAVQFVCRWRLICCEKELSIRHYFLLLAIPASMALVVVLIISWGLAMDGNTTLADCPLCPVGHTVIFAIRQDSIFLLVATLAILATNMTTYVVILVTMLLIWLKSRHILMPQHAQSREIHRQIGCILLIQAAIPMALYLVPTGLTLLYNTVGLARPGWLSIAYVQCWPSAVYPLATLLIMGQYRRILVKFLCKWHMPKTTAGAGANKAVVGVIGTKNAKQQNWHQLREIERSNPT